MSNLSIAKGSCLCRAVSLSTNSMRKNVTACHCSMCRNWGGGPLLAVDCETDELLIWGMGESGVG
ncbi:hypothetical protein H6G97_41150 [Nostoc flagelliforme FACHB-838]|uniref:CENP-V/GFA domain-containing protein n=1 Tax=Nostoc flagelliforme FACHB-838 TaxID=2692904 RepID=A0ABR8E187_9NOSO|nr:hypothetical protein [Nostoc flagelliforme FACHB-838]